MLRCIGARRFNFLLSFAIVLSVWWVLTKIYPPLVVPPIGGVTAKLGEIAANPEFRHAAGLTALRLLVGLGLGIAAGSAVGGLLGCSRRLYEIFHPLVGLVQAAPPVSWLVLALIWFGFDGWASIFIVAVGAAPVMAVNIVEGVRAVDPKLLQMAELYGFSRRKRLAHVVLPSILPYFRAGARLAIGIGGKTVVMGEVLSGSSGIGGEITNARLNLEPEGVVAWTIVAIAIYFSFNAVAARLLRGRENGSGNADDPQSGQVFRGVGGFAGSQPRG